MKKFLNNFREPHSNQIAMETFEYNIISDVDYEDLVVDIMFDGVSLATVTQEEGYHSLRIRFFYPFERTCWMLPLNDFLTTLSKTKKELWNFRKPDTPEEWQFEKITYIPKINYLMKKDNWGNKEAELYFKNNLMGVLVSRNDTLFLKVFANQEKKQEYNVPQWDILLKEFEDIINTCTKLEIGNST